MPPPCPTRRCRPPASPLVLARAARHASAPPLPTRQDGPGGRYRVSPISSRRRAAPSHLQTQTAAQTRQRVLRLCPRPHQARINPRFPSRANPASRYTRRAAPPRCRPSDPLTRRQPSTTPTRTLTEIGAALTTRTEPRPRKLRRAGLVGLVEKTRGGRRMMMMMMIHGELQPCRSRPRRRFTALTRTTGNRISRGGWRRRTRVRATRRRWEPRRCPRGLSRRRPRRVSSVVVVGVVLVLVQRQGREWQRRERLFSRQRRRWSRRRRRRRTARTRWRGGGMIGEDGPMGVSVNESRLCCVVCIVLCCAELHCDGVGQRERERKKERKARCLVITVSCLLLMDHHHHLLVLFLFIPHAVEMQNHSHACLLPVQTQPSPPQRFKLNNSST